MPRKRPLLDPLLTDIVAAIAAGKVHAAALEDEEQPNLQVYGCVLQVPGGQAMYIDEALNLIDTIVHEAIHMARPEWAEQAVKQHTTRLLARLTREDVDRIYTLYMSKRKVRRSRLRKVV